MDEGGGEMEESIKSFEAGWIHPFPSLPEQRPKAKPPLNPPRLPTSSVRRRDGCPNRLKFRVV